MVGGIGLVVGWASGAGTSAPDAPSSTRTAGVVVSRRTIPVVAAPTPPSRTPSSSTEPPSTFVGSIGRWFRPSGITVPTPAILAAAGTAGYDDSIGYDVDTLDYQDPGPSAVLANVARELRPGSIVSMHFGHRGTIEATPPIIELLASRGLRAVTLSDLLA
jgi:hypothetical protein